MTVPHQRAVLYVEDNPVNVRLVQKILRLRPHITLTVVGTGEEGLAAARAERPDLVLLDWRLPGIQGADVLRELTTDPATAGLAVVVFSGDSGRDQVTSILRSGAAAFLPKPFAIDDLLAVVDRHCG
ncbi:response regulator [Nakamurella deserti]|uniref:response regulator n=1 Tax=Nakamurella deserti TaxID=2164074 RepID=UPI000DBE8C2D|nr:response regulator [Nakamurella deserti]